MTSNSEWPTVNLKPYLKMTEAVTSELADRYMGVPEWRIEELTGEADQ